MCEKRNGQDKAESTAGGCRSAQGGTQKIGEAWETENKDNERR